jgi:cystathionine beta-lyase
MDPEAIDLTVPSLRVLQERRSQKWAIFDPDVLSLTVAEMDFPVAPVIREAVIDTIARSDLGYALPAPRTLSESLAAFAQRRLNWSLDPEQVTVVPDVMVGLAELCRTIAAPGGAVACATPAYPPFLGELPRAGVRVVPVGLTPEGSIDLGELDRAIRAGVRAFVLSNPHNPTGRALPHSELEAIAERCAAGEVWVLADEIHAPLVLSGATHVPWLEVSSAARRWGVALTSASKAFNLAALKTAFLVTAEGAAADLVARIGPQYDHASLLGEIAAEAAFREGDPWLDAVLSQLDRNRSQLGAELAERLPAVRWRPPEATYLAWLDCRALGFDREPAAMFLERGRVALAPGLDYGEPGSGHVRLNFATGPAHLSEAVDRMARAMHG